MEIFTSIITDITSFLFVVLACMVGMLIYDMTRFSAERNASFIRMLFNPELYFLSFIYKESRDLRLKGMTVEDVQSEILKRFDDRTLPFLLYDNVKKRNLEAISFTKAAVENFELFSKYVCSSAFGKDSVKELKRIFSNTQNNAMNSDVSNKKEDIPDENDPCNVNSSNCVEKEVVIIPPMSEAEKDTRLAVMNMLVDDSLSSVDKCLTWFPYICLHPVPDPNKKYRKITDGENGTSIFYALVFPKQKNLVEPNVNYPFKQTSYRDFLKLVALFRKWKPELNEFKFKSISQITDNYDLVIQNKARLNAIRSEVDRMNK